MRLAIANLTSGGLSGGYRKYLAQLLPLLRRSPQVGELQLFYPAALVSSDASETPVHAFPDGDARRGSPVLRAQLREYDPDVVFVPTSRIVPGLRCPQVIMVRNMEPLEVPFGANPPAEKLRNIGRTFNTYLACKLATRVIAVSQHVRSFLVHTWRMRGERIGVVPHGVDLPSTVRRPVALAGMAERSFLLTVGSIRPARGLEDLVLALGVLAERGQRPAVVIAGGIDPGMDDYRAHIGRLAAAHGVAGQLTWAGRLDAEELAWCYRACRAFVMTSRAEACPNTVLEALAHGCLSVSTDHPPMPEFFGNGARYYRAHDGASLASQLAALDAAAPGAEAVLRDAARARAGTYRWDVTARRTIEELGVAAATPAPRAAAVMRLFR